MINTKLYKENLDLEQYTKCANWCTANNALIADKGDYYEVVSIPEPTAKELLANTKANAQETIRAKLSSTDYKCLKFVDGDLSAEEYEATKAERQELRELFNEVEAATTLKAVNAILDQLGGM